MSSQEDSPKPAMQNRGYTGIMLIIILILAAAVVLLALNQQDEESSSTAGNTGSASLEISELSQPVEEQIETIRNRREDLDKFLDDFQAADSGQSIRQVSEDLNMGVEVLDDVERVAGENPEFDRFLTENDLPIAEIQSALNETQLRDIFEEAGFTEEQVDNYIEELQNPEIKDDAQLKELAASAGVNVALIDGFATVLEDNPGLNDFLVSMGYDYVGINNYLEDTTLSQHFMNMGLREDEAKLVVKVLEDVDYRTYLGFLAQSGALTSGSMIFAGNIYIGDTQFGYYDFTPIRYTTHVTSGDTLDIKLTSEDFDPFVRVYKQGESSPLAENDDYDGSSTIARIPELAIEEEMTLVIEVSSYQYGWGSYELDVSYR